MDILYILVSLLISDTRAHSEEPNPRPSWKKVVMYCRRVLTWEQGLTRSLPVCFPPGGLPGAFVSRLLLFPDRSICRRALRSILTVWVSGAGVVEFYPARPGTIYSGNFVRSKVSR